MWNPANLLALALLFENGVVAAQNCKTTPLDSGWPSDAEWAALNKTIGGALLRTTPVASSCWPGNPFNSPYSCEAVKGNWSSGTFHAALPESIDYPIFANNSCLPPGASGYDESRGCELGGLPEYIVNATTAEQVATAMTWAAERNIRITVKGTGHDMNGRYSHHAPLSHLQMLTVSDPVRAALTPSPSGHATSTTSSTTPPGHSPTTPRPSRTPSPSAAATAGAPCSPKPSRSAAS